MRLTHLPTGITVVASDHRSQYQNRIAALERLAEQLEERERAEQAADKRRRRRKTRRTRSANERRLKEKKAHGRLKGLRRRISGKGDD